MVIQQRLDDNLNVFCVFVGKQHTAFKWKDAISGFPVLQSSAEPLDRWGGKRKHLLISHFLSNAAAKHCRNWTVCVKTKASQGWDVFWDIVYFLSNNYAKIIKIGSCLSRVIARQSSDIFETQCIFSVVCYTEDCECLCDYVRKFVCRHLLQIFRCVSI